MCPNSQFKKEEKGCMEFELFKKIINEVKDYVYDIYLHHRGEPLLAPRFFDMVRYAKRAGLKVKFHTNGTLLTKEKSEQILEAAPDLISFSFDGFSKEVYEKIRIGAGFEKTVDNIKQFLRLRKEKKKRKPYVVIEEIEFPEYREYYSEEAKSRFSKEFKELGLDELIFKKLYNWAGDFQLPQDETLQRTYTMCTFLWYSAVILWDGTVSPCPQDFFGKLKLGNVSRNTLAEIWNGEPYQELRRRMITSVADLTPCNKCDRLCRKKVGGLPIQYLLSFLNDQLVGYGALRKMLGSYERNE